MRYRIVLRGALLASLFFMYGAQALVNPQPGDSDWTIASNVAQEVDEASPVFPTLLFNSDAVSNLITISTSGNYRVAEVTVLKIKQFYQSTWHC